MDPKDKPKQPAPADNTLPTKGTSDTQSTDADNGTNLPRPESTPRDAEPETSTPTTESEAASETPTDSTASDTALDTGADADPSASNTGNDEPL